MGCHTVPHTSSAQPTTNTNINGRQSALVTKLKTSKTYSYNMNEFKQHISNLEICQRVIALPWQRQNVPFFLEPASLYHCTTLYHRDSDLIFQFSTFKCFQAIVCLVIAVFVIVSLIVYYKDQNQGMKYTGAWIFSACCTKKN